MARRLTIVTRSPAGQEHHELDAPALIGRGEDASVRLTHPLVSREHAVVDLTEGATVLVRDLGSRNGTWVNGERVRDATVRAGAIAVVRIGGCELTVSATAPADEETVHESVHAPIEGCGNGRRSRAATIVFTDLVNSTASNVRMGDVAWGELRALHDQIIRDEAQLHAGRELMWLGDGFMFEFTGAADGLRAAIGMQRRLDERNETSDEPLQVRIGVHTGELLIDGSDIEGAHVALAARFMQHAGSGEILTSPVVEAMVTHLREFEFGAARDVALKGWEKPQPVLPVLWHHRD